MSDNLEAEFPELFDAARFLRGQAIAAGGDAADVRLRCIVAADGAVLAGKPPPDDPPSWAQVEIDGGPRPWDAGPSPAVQQPYRGKIARRR